MASDDDSFRVDSVFQESRIRGYERVQRREEREGRREGKERQKRRSGDYFRTLAKRAEASNEELEKKRLPYRFRVYQGGQKVFIDLVTLHASGKVKKTVRRNITDEDFDKWIEDLSSLEGLFLDTSA
ncbi:MAG: hypothetical protein GF418_12660 [Chitinivibrionales bacterium]|nr:hypothetical protein [Chitinivibrionales bacterium]MBD3396471.1 hypothetical protein [Chitinivibrionales bacterium]